MIEAGVREHRVNPALHRVFADELPRRSRAHARKGAPDPATDMARLTAPLIQVPDPELASFIAATAVHAVIHEAATERPELLDHPLLVDELVTLLDRYLRRPARPSTPVPRRTRSPAAGQRRRAATA
jgi:hypothetical protein